MDTTAAAAQAGVTVATIRTWCRIGAVKAAKVAGRWVIAAASLTRRIQIGASRKEARMETPAHQRAGVAQYRRHKGQWTVHTTGAVLDSAARAAKRNGGPITITVTKKDGSTKQQAVTGTGWKDTVSKSREYTTYFLRLPEEDQQTEASAARTRTTSGECAQCGRYSRYLEDAPDSSGIVLPVCGRCGRMDDYLRSYG